VPTRVDAFAVRTLLRTQLDPLGRLVGIGGGLQGLEQCRRDLLVALGAVHGATKDIVYGEHHVSSGDQDRWESGTQKNNSYLTLVSDGQVVTALTSS